MSTYVHSQAISTLAQVASPLATANKGYDAEQEQMRACIHRQMLASDLLAVSLGLGRAAGVRHMHCRAPQAWVCQVI